MCLHLGEPAIASTLAIILLFLILHFSFASADCGPVLSLATRCDREFWNFLLKKRKKKKKKKQQKPP